MPSLRRLTPHLLLAATVGVLALAVYFDIRAGHRGETLIGLFVGSIAALSSAGVGMLLASRLPGNPIGWILLASGLLLALMGATEAYARLGILADPGSVPYPEWAVVFEDRAWPGLFAGITAVAYLFPTGRLPSPRWRGIACLTIGSFTCMLALTPFSPEAFTSPFAAIANPVPSLPSTVYSVLASFGMLGMLAGMIGAAVSVRSRFETAVGIERQQLRWLAYAAVVIPAGVLICLAEIAITGGDGVATFVAVAVAISSFPVAIGIAITRYRLYEFDRLVNRTLVYGTLTALLGGIFAGISLVIGLWAGSGSAVPTAVATLAVAVSFGPLRSRAQRIVDRRFNRARYFGLRHVESFLEDLRAGRAAPEAIQAVLAEALGDPGLILLYRVGVEDGLVDASGAPARLPRGPGHATVPVTRGDLHLGSVSHDAKLGERPDLVQSIIGAAGLAIEIGRLRAEVSNRLAEVRESRARIVTAGNLERRRLERDLHDGAQQRLVSIGLSLRHLQQQMPDTNGASTTLDLTVAELGTAIEELRELARGVRPPALDDGLAAALRQLAARCPIPIDVDATSDRFGEDLEAAAYFVASEALANCVKHAEADAVSMRAVRVNGALVVRISDDGLGGARPGAGSGLAGMGDRLAALGGTLDLASPDGKGTTVTASFPCV